MAKRKQVVSDAVRQEDCGPNGAAPPPDTLTLKEALEIVFDMADDDAGCYGETIDEWRTWLKQLHQIVLKEIPPGIISRVLTRAG